jgi:hypothetical protein
MVVRSLWAALGEVWVVGLFVGWVVDRLLVCGLVMGSVVVAVDIVSPSINGDHAGATDWLASVDFEDE